MAWWRYVSFEGPVSFTWWFALLTRNSKCGMWGLFGSLFDCLFGYISHTWFTSKANNSKTNSTMPCLQQESVAAEKDLAAILTCWFVSPQNTINYIAKERNHGQKVSETTDTWQLNAGVFRPLLCSPRQVWVFGEWPLYWTKSMLGTTISQPGSLDVWVEGQDLKIQRCVVSSCLL